MLSRDRIISSALLKLGEVRDYSDNRSEVYVIASQLLEDVLDAIAFETDFLFNATTVSLTLYEENDGEYVYNLPIDFLNKLEFVGGLGRIENEYIYSNKSNLKLRYCRKIDFNEYPDYLFRYLIYALAVELAESYNQYQDRLSTLMARLHEEKLKVYSVEFTPRVRKL